MIENLSNEQFKMAQSHFFLGDYADAYTISVSKVTGKSSSPDFLRLLGWICCEKNSPNYNLEESKKWFEQAIKIGDVESIHGLAGVYLQKNDFENALKNFKKCADLNYAPSLCRIGIFYKNGFIVDKSKTKALYFFKKSAELGNIIAKQEMINLALYSKTNLLKKLVLLANLLTLIIKVFFITYKKGTNAIELLW